MELAVPVGIGPYGLSAEHRDEVVSEVPGLANCVLGRGRGRHSPVREIRNGGTVARAPRVLRADDAEVRSDPDTPFLIEGQVGTAEHRVRLHACSPHERAGVELVAVGEPDPPVDGGLHPGVQAQVDASSAELCGGAAAHALSYVVKDPSGELHEHPLEVGWPHMAVVAAGRAGHVLEFAERLDPREASSYDDERQGASAYIRVTRRFREVKPAEYVVAQGDGLLGPLEADAALLKAGNGRQTCDSAHCEDQVVIRDVVGRAFRRLDRHAMVPVSHSGGPSAEHLYPGQHSAQGNDDVARLKGPGRCFGKERLVCHEISRGHEKQFGLTAEAGVGSRRALNRPANPPPTMTMRGEVDVMAARLARRRS